MARHLRTKQQQDGTGADLKRGPAAFAKVAVPDETETENALVKQQGAV